MKEKMIIDRMEDLKEIIKIEKRRIKDLEYDFEFGFSYELEAITMNLMVAYRILAYLQGEYIEVLEPYRPKKEIPLKTNLDDLLNEFDLEEPLEDPEFIKENIENKKEGEQKKWIQ